MEHIKKIVLLCFAASALTSVWILRVSSISVRDEYAIFTDTVFIISLILLVYFYISDKRKNNNDD